MESNKVEKDKTMCLYMVLEEDGTVCENKLPQKMLGYSILFRMLCIRDQVCSVRKSICA